MVASKQKTKICSIQSAYYLRGMTRKLWLFKSAYMIEVVDPIAKKDLHFAGLWANAALFKRKSTLKSILTCFFGVSLKLRLYSSGRKHIVTQSLKE